MAIFCEKYSLLYLCTAKTGSTSVSTALIDQLGGKWIPNQHIWENSKILVDYKHSTLQQLLNHQLINKEKLAELNIFLTTRNPYSWVLSDYLFQLKCYERYKKEGDSAPDWITARISKISNTASQKFDEYLKSLLNFHSRSVYKYYIEGFETWSNITILKIENIENSFTEYLKEVDIDLKVEIPYCNLTLKKPINYQKYYSEEGKEIVKKLFREDFKELGYDV